MITNLDKIIVLTLISIILYFFNLKLFRSFNKKINIHQKYSTDILGNPMGGYVIASFIILFKFYLDYLELFFLLSIFISGILSDIKIFNSPLKRLFFQILIIITCISFSDIGIISTRINFIDHFLMNKIINIIFTSFCILIVINGSNFIDGLNGLVIGYYLIIVTILINTDLSIDLYFQRDLFINLTVVLYVLLIFNFLNKVFLGDNGSYLIGFLFSIYLIRFHQTNIYVSPYFIILLLWYPCFENLFSIIRKKISKMFATDPDNSHLHQLFFFFILKKYKIRNKLIANNLTSLVINLYHIFIFFIGLKNIYNTNIQITLLLINLIIYIYLYVALNRFKKSLQ